MTFNFKLFYLYLSFYDHSLIWVPYVWVKGLKYSPEFEPIACSAPAWVLIKIVQLNPNLLSPYGLILHCGLYERNTTLAQISKPN